MLIKDEDGYHGQLSGSLLDCLIELTFFYERRMTKDSLISGLPIKNEQLTIELFERAADRADFLSKDTPLTFADLHPGVLPCVLIMKNNQYVILFEIEDDYATIFEGNDKKAIKLSQLEDAYDGSVILVKPKDNVPKEKKSEALFNIKKIPWFWGVVKSTWSTYAEVILASFFINLFVLTAPLFAMNVYNRVVPNNAIATLWALAIGVFVIYVFDLIIKLLRTHFIDNAAYKIDTRLSALIFEHIIGIRMSSRPKFVGQIINNMQGFEAFRDFMTSLTVTVLIDFPFILLFIVFIWIIGGRLALVPLFLIPITLLISFFIQAPLIEVVKKNYEATAEKQRTLIESLIGIHTIKTQNAEGVIQRKWEKLVAYTAKLNIRLKFLTSLAINVSVFFQYLGSVIVIIAGVYMIANNNLSIGALIASTILTGRALAPVSQAVGLILRYYQSLTSIQSLDTMMKLPVERPAGVKFLNPEKVTESIEFLDVSFHYETSPNTAIDSISLKINPKEHVAILGKVGSGKTTFLKLMLGLYQADKGKINFSGQDIQKIDPVLLRKHIGYVPQDPILFNGSIRDNIVLGDPNASDDAILAAIEASGLGFFISEHLDGISTEVGERGGNLSGGQRQAVAIAQAFLHSPNLLIFDEPTTSFDEINEAQFRQRVSEIMQDKTLILATHKANMLALVNRIIILDRGRVIADGPKEDVLQSLKDNKVKIPKR